MENLFSRAVFGIDRKTPTAMLKPDSFLNRTCFFRHMGIELVMDALTVKKQEPFVTD